MIPAPTFINEYGTAELCPGPYYFLDSGMAFPECLAIEWYATQTPQGGISTTTTVDFTSPRGLTTYVRVPVAGLYCFGFRCVQEL